MRTAVICAAALLAGLIGAENAAQAGPAVPERQPTVSDMIPVQDWHQRCRYLRHRLRELEQSRAYAPPWEQRRIDRRIWRTREDLRQNRCR